MKYQGTMPNILVKYDNNKVIKETVRYALNLASDNRYGYKKYGENEKTQQCPICHPDSGLGVNCIGLASVAYHHGGRVSSVSCAMNGIGYDGMFDTLTATKWKNRNGKKWKMITNGGSKGGEKIKYSTLKKGDIGICYDSKGKYKHTILIYEDGKIIDATSSHGVAVRKYSSLGSRCTRVFRYTGTGKSREYLTYGDEGVAVKNLQKFLVWAGYSVPVSGLYGDKTKEAVKKFQKDNGLKSTGSFGKAALTKAIKLNIETPKIYSGEYPNPKIEVSRTRVNTAQVILNTCNELAFPYGTPVSQYKYRHDKRTKVTKYDADRPTEANKKALDAIFPEHWNWGDKSSGYAKRLNASGEDFVALVVRYSKIDKKFPRDIDLTATGKYKSSTMSRIKFTKKEQLKPGDVVSYKSPTGKHTYIYMGNGKRCDAGPASRHGVILKLRAMDTAGHTTAYIYRAPIVNKYEYRYYIQKGDECKDVGYWRAFLKWYFNDNTFGMSDIFNDKTEELTIRFQTEMGIEPDGLVGPLTIGKAKVVKK